MKLWKWIAAGFGAVAVVKLVDRIEISARGRDERRGLRHHWITREIEEVLSMSEALADEGVAEGGTESPRRLSA